jgi:hypothetical protein
MVLSLQLTKSKGRNTIRLSQCNSLEKAVDNKLNPNKEQANVQLVDHCKSDKSHSKKRDIPFNIEILDYSSKKVIIFQNCQII